MGALKIVATRNRVGLSEDQLLVNEPESAASEGIDANMQLAARRVTEGALARSVGARIKAARLGQRRTLRDISRRSGVSMATLSRIENAQLSPSLRTLGRLSTALGTPVTAFFRGIDEEHDASFVKAGHGIELVRPGTSLGHRYEMVAVPVQQRRRIEAWLVTLPEPAEVFPLYQHDGSELIYMLDGRLTWRYGHRVFDMEPGDSLLLDASVAHGPEELVVAPARFLGVAIQDCPSED